MPALLQYVPDGQGTRFDGSSQVKPLGQGKHAEDTCELQVPTSKKPKTLNIIQYFLTAASEALNMFHSYCSKWCAF